MMVFKKLFTIHTAQKIRQTCVDEKPQSNKKFQILQNNIFSVCVQQCYINICCTRGHLKEETEIYSKQRNNRGVSENLQSQTQHTLHCSFPQGQLLRLQPALLPSYQ